MAVTYSWCCDSNNLRSQLLDSDNNAFLLLGYIHREHYFILSAVSIDNNIESTVKEIKAILPLGYCIVGAINVKKEELEPYFGYPFILGTFDEYEYDIVVRLSDGASVQEENGASIEKILETCYLFRVRCVAYASVPLESSTSDIIEAFNHTIDEDTFLLVGDTIIDSASTGTIETSITRDSPVEYPNFPKWLKNVYEFEAADRLSRPYSPSILTLHDRRQFICLPFDILLLFNGSEALSSVIPTVKNHMKTQVPYVLEFKNSTHFSVSPYLLVTLFHSHTEHPFITDLTQITKLRSEWKNDAEAEWRKKWNIRFGLKTNRPFFRLSNSLFSPSHPELADQSIVWNPHESMPAVESSWLIQGSILYFHYGHQGVSDRGWGCAYRSLQSLLSFYSVNHYVDMRIPTIPEIQQVLVDIGDKPSSFRGSREWIGSQEVGYVLGTLLDVDSKFIIMDKGSEAKKHMNQLRDHFISQGTPVMIGGGVLSFTCVGISMNPKSGEVKLLILDPHYTGRDDIKAITSEKVKMEGYYGFGCGWKSLKEVFRDKEFYRLCLPQRPEAYCNVC